MAKSRTLRVSDVQKVYRLISECRDLGADPVAWREHLIAGACQLVSAQVAVTSHSQIVADFHRQPVTLPRISVCGWTDEQAERGFWALVQNHDLGKMPVFLSFVSRLPQQPTLRRIQFVSNQEWYNCYEFNECWRPLGVDDFIGSGRLIPTGEGGTDFLRLFRPVGESSFDAREGRIVKLLHDEIHAMVGRSLAEANEASASDLTPRPREMLECLLQGDSEKRAAARLGISRGTAHDYVKAIYRHFDVQSRAELMARWVRYGRSQETDVV